MDESYLNADSRGIFPQEFDDNSDYLLRAIRMLECGNSPQFRKEILGGLDKKDKKHFWYESPAPKEVYDLMVSEFDCEVSWIPYFKVKIYDRWTCIKDLFNFRGGNCKSVFSQDHRTAVPRVAVEFEAGEKDIAVHEFIHAVRAMALDKPCIGRDRIVAELFAEKDRIIPTHTVFMNHPVYAATKYFDMRSAYKRLEDAFEEKADYAFIRLTEEEIDDINSCGKSKVRDYFKERAIYLQRRNYISRSGKLRFQIMCEKLGL